MDVKVSCKQTLAVNLVKKALGLGLALLVVGCGSQASDGSKATAAKSSADLLRALDCRDEALALLAPEDLRHVPAEDVIVQQDQSTVNWCSLLRANPGTKLALFQFTSLACFDCQKWVAQVNEGVTAYGVEVLPVVVLTGAPHVVTDADLAELRTQTAPDAVWVRDLTGEAWRFFAPTDATDRVSPVTVAMDVAARGFLTEDTALGAKELVERANADMKLAIKGAP